MDQEKINQYNQAQQEEAKRQELLDTIYESSSVIEKAISDSDNKTKDVNVINSLATPDDIAKVVSAVNALSNDLKPQDIAPIVLALNTVSEALSKLPTEYPQFPELPEAPEPLEAVKVTNLVDLKQYFTDVVNAVGKLQTSIKFDPNIVVKPADVNITEKEIDLTPITKGLANLEKAFKSIKTPEIDLTELIKTTKKVGQAVNNLSFPIPNYVLPFKDSSGTAAQAELIPLGTQLTTSNKGVVTNTIIHGITTGGGGGYVDVKVNPSGALVTDASGSSVDIKNNQVIKFASVSISASGDNAIVAAVTSKKIKVLSCTLVSSGTVSVKWRSGTTDLSGAMPLVANSGFVLPASAPGQGHYLETAVNTALNINLSGAVQVSGLISYYEEA